MSATSPDGLSKDARQRLDAYASGTRARAYAAVTSHARATWPVARPARRQRGFSMAAAVFLIVVLAGLGVALLTVNGLQHGSSALDVQGVRAYQAARAGAEWGMYQVLSPDATPALPSCWAGTATVSPGSTLAAFTVQVTCSATQTTEVSKSITVYSIVSTASQGAGGAPNSVTRQVSATVSRCADPANSTNFFAC